MPSEMCFEMRCFFIDFVTSWNVTIVDSLSIFGYVSQTWNGTPVFKNGSSWFQASTQQLSFSADKMVLINSKQILRNFFSNHLTRFFEFYVTQFLTFSFFSHFSNQLTNSGGFRTIWAFTARFWWSFSTTARIFCPFSKHGIWAWCWPQTSGIWSERRDCWQKT